MPQVIQVTSRKFFNQLTNGENFGSNTSDYATHLLGSVGERVKADITFVVSWNSKATPQNKFAVNFTTNTITRTSGSFIDDGFRIGDLFDAINENPSITNYAAITGATITYIDDLTIQYTGGSETTGQSPFSYLNIKGRTSLTAMKLFYGISENSQPAAFISKLDNTTPGFYASGLTTSPTTASVLGVPRSWFFDDAVEIYKVSSTTYTQTFRFTHEFVITPFYLEGEENNIENLIDPPYFQQGNSLKYVFKADLNTALSNPNTVHSFIDDLLLGEVAYYNENFNGLQNIFSTQGLTYKNASSLYTADGLLITQKTRVNFELHRSSGAFIDNTSRLIVSVFYLCPADEYSNTQTTDGYENFMLYQKRVVCDSSSPVPVSNGDITALTATFISATQIDVEFDFELSATEQSRLSTDGKFCISVIAETDGLTAVNSDKVHLIVDVENFDLYTDIPQLMSFSRKSVMWIHPQNPATSSGSSSIRMWNEDAFMTKAICSLNYVTYPNANIVSIVGRLIGYNSSTEEWFELDSYEFDLSGVQTINGVQQISIDTPRSFQLEPGDPYLNASIVMGANTPGTTQVYDIYIPWKMRYEDFIANPNVPSDFFDSAQENNGQNYKSSNYSISPDWSVRVVYDILINNGTPGVDTLYRYHFAANDVHDYDQDGNSPAEWTAEIKLYRASNNQLLSTGSTGLVLSNEDTLVEATFTPATGAGYLLLPWAVLRMEVLNSGYNGIFELSSVSARVEPANNPLIPETGQNGAKITQGASNVKVTGIIDHTKIDPSAIYKISARLGGIQYGGPGDETAIKLEDAIRYKVTEQGELKLTEEPL